MEFGLTHREHQIYRSLRKPAGIQRFLDEEIGYNKEPDGPTCFGPRIVLRDGLAHCMEGSLFAAAALRVLGFPPLILDLEAQRDDDHVLAVFRVDGYWGAIAKSNYAGLRFREPVYRSLRELALSYFEHYYNPAGEKTLRAYARRPVNLRRFDPIQWMTTEDHVWAIPEYLCAIHHVPLVTHAQLRHVSRMDKRSYGAGRYGMLL